MSAAHGTSGEGSRHGFEVLWVGETPLASDIVRALSGREIHVQVTSVGSCAQEIAARAPNLLVLSGIAGGQLEAIWSGLRQREPFAMVSVALVGPEDRSIERLRRMGVVARLSDGLEAEELASELHALLRALATRRSSSWDEGVTWDEIDTWLTRTARDGSCGLLMTSEPTAAMMVGPDGQTAPAVRMLKNASRAKGPRTVRFVELPAGRVQVLREAKLSLDGAQLHGTRVLLVHPVPERRAALAAALTARGAELHAIGKDADSLIGAAAFEPALIVVAAPSLMGPQAENLWRDSRFAACSWVVLDETAPKPLMPDYVAQVAASLSEHRRALRTRLERGELVLGRIESFRAAGWLAVLVGTQGAISVVLEGAAGAAEVELRNGVVDKVRFGAGLEQNLEGTEALEAMHSLTGGRVLAGNLDHVRVRRGELAVPRVEASPSMRPATLSGRPPLNTLGPGASNAPEAAVRARNLKLAGAILLCVVLAVFALYTPRSPLDAEDAARLERAKGALADARYDEAQRLLSTLVLRHPADFDLRYDLALSLLKLHRPREARTELERARAIDDTAAQVWFLLGETYLEEQNKPAALDAWKRCLELRRYLPCQERLATWRE